jgi:hypothetical protein
MPTSSLESLKTYVDHRLRSYARAASLGFLILVVGTGFAMYESNAVSRNNSNLICGIVYRLDAANKKNFEDGKITLKQREEAHETYGVLLDASNVSCKNSPIVDALPNASK